MIHFRNNRHVGNIKEEFVPVVDQTNREYRPLIEIGPPTHRMENAGYIGLYSTAATDLTEWWQYFYKIQAEQGT